SGGNGGNRLSGYTDQNYAQIVLGANSKILNYGSITCTGYIFEKELGNKSEVYNYSGSNIYAPFSVVEHRGGTVFSNMVGIDMGGFDFVQNDLVCAPFNRFKMHNISSLITFQKGSFFYAVADLAARKSITNSDTGHHFSTINMIGNSNSYLINLSSEDGGLTYKFYTADYTDSLGIYHPAEVAEVRIYGSFQFNPLNLKLDIGVSINLSTADVYFPISYLLDIRLSKGLKNSVSNVVLNQKIKIMTGAKFIIDEGVSVTADSIFVYDSYDDNSQTTAQSNNCKYPLFDSSMEYGVRNRSFASNGSLNYEAGSVSGTIRPCISVGPGLLEVNGSLTVNSLGGTVKTKNANATLVINTSVTPTSKELYDDVNATCGYTDVTPNQASGYVKDNGTGTISKANLEVSPYVSVFEQETYAWGKASDFKKYYIQLHPGYSSGVEITDSSISLSSLPIQTYYTKELPANILSVSYSVSRNGYEFEGWYFDQNYTQKVGVASKQATEDGQTIIVYAKWVEKEYSISYMWYSSSATLDNSLITNHQDNPSSIVPSDLPLQLKAPNENIDNYHFVHWAVDTDLDGKPETQIPNNTITSEMLISDSLLIYGVFQEDAISYTYITYNYLDNTGSVTSTRTQHKTSGDRPATSKLELSKPATGDYNINFKLDTTNSTLQSHTFKHISIKVKDREKEQISVSDSGIFSSNLSSGSFLVNDGGVYKLDFSSLSNGDKIVVEEIFESKVYGYTLNLDGSKSGSTGTVVASVTFSINNSNSNDVPSIPGLSNVIKFIWDESSAKNSKITYKMTANESEATITKSGSSWISPNPSGNLKCKYYLTINGVDILLGEKSVSLSDSCLYPSTLITMADGTHKKAEDIRQGDLVKAFNHFTGKIEVQPIILNAHIEQEERLNEILTLKFTSSKEIEIIGEHGFFDKTLNQYVYIDINNYKEYIGHEFISINKNTLSNVMLLSGSIREETCKVYSPVTAGNYNIISNDLLSFTGELSTGFMNIFEFDEDLKYNEKLMKQDIETYGLFTYEDLSMYISEDMFNALNAKYLKVSIGKGLVTYEDFDRIIRLYGKYIPSSI
ncbi:MAG: Hint domain-containing protein, partial [Candidatus Onthovivens sp.]|nr:Hint domain-containing protein [Candidatus Onthovivens sp.]